jgi:membrane associated rhomboid family serine protease
MFSFLNNIPQVTKNILLINVMLSIVTFILGSQNIDLGRDLGAYYMNSPLFRPYQIVTHFFMHDGSSIMHLFMNMYLLVILGSYLERLWGPKKYFVLYIISALGAFALYNAMGMYQISELRNSFTGVLDINRIDSIMNNSQSMEEIVTEVNNYLHTLSGQQVIDTNLLQKYISFCSTPMVGASGAVFGVMAAFAILFPNTEFMLYFAIPVKAKFLVGAYFLFELYLSFNGTPGDNVAHLAHVGGAIAGAIMILYWRKTDKKNFW